MEATINPQMGPLCPYCDDAPLAPRAGWGGRKTGGLQVTCGARECRRRHKVAMQVARQRDVAAANRARGAVERVSTGRKVTAAWSFGGSQK